MLGERVAAGRGESVQSRTSVGRLGAVGVQATGR